MKHEELAKALTDAGFTTGWAVEDDAIVLWENSEPVPSGLQEYIKFD